MQPSTSDKIINQVIALTQQKKQRFLPAVYLYAKSRKLCLVSISGAAPVQRSRVLKSRETAVQASLFALLSCGSSLTCWSSPQFAEIYILFLLLSFQLHFSDGPRQLHQGVALLSSVSGVGVFRSALACSAHHRHQPHLPSAAMDRLQKDQEGQEAELFP